MPRQDGRGPLGQGPRTGRGLGKCKPAGTQKNSLNDEISKQPIIWRWLDRLFMLRYEDEAGRSSRGQKNRSR